MYLNEWYYANVICYVKNVAEVSTISASIYTLVVLSIDRYVFIHNPRREHPRKNFTILIIIGIWIVSIISGLPYFFTTTTQQWFIIDKTNGLVYEKRFCSKNILTYNTFLAM